MKNKKLIKILLKDMGELEELISDVKSNGNYDAMEMEFIHTRAKGVLQLLHLFDTRADMMSPEAGVSHDEENLQENREPDQKASPVTEEYQQDMKIKEEEEEENETTESDRDSVGQPDNQTAEITTDIKEKVSPKKSDDRDEDDEMLGEEEEKTEANSRLGDSFLKEKSINDLITDQHKLEFKLSNRPVSSIKAAIGINDQFQYIRELFDSNPQKFLNTVEALDSMGNIKEAVEYLRLNFKWKKTETSLKFVNLIKRRFLNST